MRRRITAEVLRERSGLTRGLPIGSRTVHVYIPETMTDVTHTNDTAVTSFE